MIIKTNNPYLIIRNRLSINLKPPQNGVWGGAPSKVAGAAAPEKQPLPEGKGLGDRDCTSQQKLDRKNISLYNKNIKIGQFKLENYTIL